MCLCPWACPGHCRIFASISYLSPLDARSIPHDCDNQHLQTLLMSPGGQSYPWLRSAALEKEAWA